jgi:hypothetical protein
MEIFFVCFIHGFDINSLNKKISTYGTIPLKTQQKFSKPLDF